MNIFLLRLWVFSVISFCSTMQIIGLSFAVVFFALMQQANSWELDLPIPSMLGAVESNLRMPLPFLYLAILPILTALFYSFLSSQPSPPAMSFLIISVVCYLFANGSVIMLILVSQLAFYVAASAHVLIRMRLVFCSPISCTTHA